MKKLLIYCWINPHYVETLKPALISILETLSKYSVHFDILLDKSTCGESFPEVLPKINFFYSDLITRPREERDIYPLIASTLDTLERDHEELIMLLKSIDFKLENNDESFTTPDIVQIKSMNDFYSDSLSTLLDSKKKFLQKQFSLADTIKDDRPLHLLERLKLAISKADSRDLYPEYILKKDLALIEEILFRFEYRKLLMAQVDLAYFIHAGIEPQIGWIEYDAPSIEQPEKYEIRNPFLSLQHDLTHGGVITKIDYFPRKFLLNESSPSLFFSIGRISTPKEFEPIASSLDKWRLMRKQPDLISLRFDEEPISNLEENALCTIAKVIYLKGGLGSFMPNSTSGFSCEFWIEEWLGKNSTIPLNLHLPLLFPAQQELIQIRALSPFGGETDTLYNAESALLIKKDSIESGLSGIRLINSAEHFVIDIRFTRPINNINLIPKKSFKTKTLLDIRFELDFNSALTYEKVQALHFCIY